MMNPKQYHAVSQILAFAGPLPSYQTYLQSVMSDSGGRLNLCFCFNTTGVVEWAEPLGKAWFVRQHQQNGAVAVVHLILAKLPVGRKTADWLGNIIRRNDVLALVAKIVPAET